MNHSLSAARNDQRYGRVTDPAGELGKSLRTPGRTVCPEFRSSREWKDADRDPFMIRENVPVQLGFHRLCRVKVKF